MKIGLLTLTPSHNYGGILQTVALYSHLKSLGHEVTLIDSQPLIPLWKKVIFKMMEVTPFQNLKNKKEIKRKASQLALFIKKNLSNLSEAIYHSDDLKRLVEKQKFDAVVVGSDQVWRYQYIKQGDYSVYFLNFKVDFPVKKIAYAASFGKDSWEAPAEVKKIKSLIKDFSAVSVREKTGVDLCRELFGFERSAHVLDPTILVGEEFYSDFFTENILTNEPIVTYILDKNESKAKVINSVAKNKLHSSKGQQIVNLGEKHNGKYYSVEEWLSYIENASFVLTDSFHGMVFSILFKKQFVVIGNHERGLSRFTSFLSSLDLEDRLLLSDKPSDLEAIIDSIIDYKTVTAKIEKLQEVSKQFLTDALE